MYGNMIVDLCVGVWLFVASYYQMPVSTTHSCVGGMIGMTMVTVGPQCVIWVGTNDFGLPTGVVAIIVSWFISPIASGLIATTLFAFTRTFILRAKNSLGRVQMFYPALIWFTIWINTFYLLAKGLNKQICNKGDTVNNTLFLCVPADEDGNASGKVHAGIAAGFSAAIGFGCALLAIPATFWMKKQVERRITARREAAEASRLEEAEAAESLKARIAAGEVIDVKADEAEVVLEVLSQSLSAKLGRLGRSTKAALSKSINYDSHGVIGSDAVVAAIHSRAEVFDETTEEYFKYVQIVTACCDSFAHGANDVANAMAPFMSIYFIYNYGAPTGKKLDTAGDGIWILAMGGAFISLGLILYGYRIVEALGVKLATITPSRGYCIELGASCVIIAGSFVGMPLSTTHCQVGATYGVGMIESKQKCGLDYWLHNEGVNNWLMAKTVLGWVLTVVLVAISVGFLTSWGVWAPLSLPLEESLLNTKCPTTWLDLHNYTFLNGTVHM